MIAQHLPHRTRILWVAAASLLMLACAVHLYAQDAEPLAEPEAIMNAESTEAAEILPPTDMPATPEPVITVEPPSPEPPLPTPIPTEVTIILPTLEVTAQPPTVETLTTQPEAVPPTEVDPSETLPTLPPLPEIITATPALPTSVPQMMPNLQLLPGPSSQQAGESASVLLVGNALASVSSMALACWTDVALFQPHSATPNGLMVVAGTLMDNGPQPDGRWVLLWVRSLPDADSPTPTVLLQMNYMPLLGGNATLACDVTLGDRYGALLGTVRLETLLSAPPAITPTVETPVIVEPEATELVILPEATATEIVLMPEATETPIPVEGSETLLAPEMTETPIAPETTETTLTVESTPELTETPSDRLIVVPEVVETVPMVEVTGHVGANASEVVLLWVGETMHQQIATEADGTFTVPLLAGVYTLRVTALHHVTYETQVSIVEGMSPVAIRLVDIDIDIDGSGAVDTGDVDTLVAYFNQPVPHAPRAADLNGDGWVDLYDLAILGANLGG